MEIVIFMRVLFFMSYCPSICFSKSFLRVYSPCSLKLEDAHHFSSSDAPVTPVVEDKSSELKSYVKENEPHIEKSDLLMKSILKKPSGGGIGEVGKGRVKWVDFVGKELAEIREFDPFEPNDSEDTGSASCQACICSIQ